MPLDHQCTLPANVQSLDNKLDELHRPVNSSHAMVTTGKVKGAGVCFLINNSW